MDNPGLDPDLRDRLESFRKQIEDKRRFVKVTILLLLDSGRTFPEISDILGCSPECMEACRTYFRHYGLQAYLEDSFDPFGSNFSAPLYEIIEVQHEDAVLLRSIKALILEHIDQSYLTPAYIGKKLGMSISMLHRKLTALAGLSPGRFIHRIRLEEAKSRLHTSRNSITEIAYEVGFKDPAYFTRLFTKEFGRPPSYFRNSKYDSINRASGD